MPAVSGGAWPMEEDTDSESFIRRHQRQNYEIIRSNAILSTQLRKLQNERRVLADQILELEMNHNRAQVQILQMKADLAARTESDAALTDIAHHCHHALKWVQSTLHSMEHGVHILQRGLVPLLAHAAAHGQRSNQQSSDQKQSSTENALATMDILKPSPDLQQNSESMSPVSRPSSVLSENHAEMNESKSKNTSPSQSLSNHAAAAINNAADFEKSFGQEIVSTTSVTEMRRSLRAKRGHTQTHAGPRGRDPSTFRPVANIMRLTPDHEDAAAAKEPDLVMEEARPDADEETSSDGEPHPTAMPNSMVSISAVSPPLVPALESNARSLYGLAPVSNRGKCISPNDKDAAGGTTVKSAMVPSRPACTNDSRDLPSSDNNTTNLPSKASDETVLLDPQASNIMVPGSAKQSVDLSSAPLTSSTTAILVTDDGDGHTAIVEPIAPVKREIDPAAIHTKSLSRGYASPPIGEVGGGNVRRPVRRRAILVNYSEPSLRR
ncbi:hypothetical protein CAUPRSCDRAFT_10290 [Caulochytrium protostelioides]|uniref:Uncharacterized protein n=1 Tax=Caulochytrium protostelioides TaxID=1555241 RepID=A0A4P9X1M6_9FUNG|nr:hypothetical protein CAUPRSCDRAFT_10290 [Caulochytrium protostelioides]